MCVCVPSCIIQGSSGAHCVLSPYLYTTNISFNLWILVAVTTSPFNPFQVSIILCGKLLFVFFTHRLFLIFLECPLICLVSSSIITGFVCPAFQYHLLSYIELLDHLSLSLLSCSIGSPISSNLCSYVSSLNSGTIFVATLWILSNFLISFLALGDHTTAAYYYNLGCIILVRIFFMSLSM